MKKKEREEGTENMPDHAVYRQQQGVTGWRKAPPPAKANPRRKHLTAWVKCGDGVGWSWMGPRRGSFSAPWAHPCLGRDRRWRRGPPVWLERGRKVGQRGEERRGETSWLLTGRRDGDGVWNMSRSVLSTLPLSLSRSIHSLFSPLQAQVNGERKGWRVTGENK